MPLSLTHLIKVPSITGLMQKSLAAGAEYGRLQITTLLPGHLAI